MKQSTIPFSFDVLAASRHSVRLACSRPFHSVITLFILGLTTMAPTYFITYYTDARTSLFLFYLRAIGIYLLSAYIRDAALIFAIHSTTRTPLYFSHIAYRAFLNLILSLKAVLWILAGLFNLSILRRFFLFSLLPAVVARHPHPKAITLSEIERKAGKRWNDLFWLLIVITFSVNIVFLIPRLIPGLPPIFFKACVSAISNLMISIEIAYHLPYFQPDEVPDYAVKV